MNEPYLTLEPTEKHFRQWMLKNYGIQEAANYKGTQAEELAIQYAKLFRDRLKELEELASIKVIGGTIEKLPRETIKEDGTTTEYFKITYNASNKSKIVDP